MTEVLRSNFQIKEVRHRGSNLPIIMQLREEPTPISKGMGFSVLRENREGSIKTICQYWGGKFEMLDLP